MSWAAFSVPLIGLGNVPQVSDDLLDRQDVETGLTVRESLRLMVAALAGDLSGNGTGTLVIKSAGGSTTRITATIDANGDRVVTISP